MCVCRRQAWTRWRKKEKEREGDLRDRAGGIKAKKKNRPKQQSHSLTPSISCPGSLGVKIIKLASLFFVSKSAE